MAVAQVAFEIPAAIQAGLDNGTLIRFGGVVRNSAGHIVTHLKELPLSQVDNGKHINSVVAFAQKNKYVLIGTAVAVTATGIVYIVVKNKKNQEVKIPKCIADFNKAFIEYMDSIRTGAVSEKKINKLLVALAEIKHNQVSGSIDITFSAENVQLLLDMVKNYTIEFAKANSCDLTDDDFIAKDKIFELQNYLNIQKQIFEKCS